MSSLTPEDLRAIEAMQHRIDETARALLAAMVADHGAYTETPEGRRSVENDVRRARDAAEIAEAERARRLRARLAELAPTCPHPESPHE